MIKKVQEHKDIGMGAGNSGWRRRKRRRRK
jgi:hypothetical protein